MKIKINIYTDDGQEFELDREISAFELIQGDPKKVFKFEFNTIRDVIYKKLFDQTT